MLNVLSDFRDLDVLSAADYCSLECDETVLVNFTGLLEESDNNHNYILHHCLLYQVSYLGQHNLHQAAKKVLPVV